MKRLVIEIDDDLRKAIKAAAFRTEKTMKQYVTDVLKKELEKTELKK